MAIVPSCSAQAGKTLDVRWLTGGGRRVRGRTHRMPAQTGWEEIADYALSWAVEHAAAWAVDRGVQARRNEARELVGRGGKRLTPEYVSFR